MKLVFNSYTATEDIPILSYLKNRKLAKYLNRETMAAVVAVGKLLELTPLPLDISFYYATGMLEYQDYGLHQIVTASRDEAGQFSHQLFVEEGIAAVSPLNQFKVLQNMPLSFAAINFGLTGDNAVLYSSAGSLLRQALCATDCGPFLIGAGKVYCDGTTECGFAVVDVEELQDSHWLTFEGEAVDVFREWAEEQRL
jgi:hypothetical protein